MFLTHKLKLLPSEDQKIALLVTMERFNEACDFVALNAVRIKSANKLRLQKEIYYELREKLNLPAQLAIRAIAKVCEVYKRDKNVRPRFEKHGAVVYDQRILSWKNDCASIATMDGRTLIPFVGCDYYEERKGIMRRQADLILKKGVFFLCVIIEVQEAEEIKPFDSLGLDLGIVNLAVDSDGETHSGEVACIVRKRIAKLRSALQSRSTKSARKHLKRLSGKEREFQRNVNHCISKHIVAKAKDTKRAIVL